MQPGHTISAAPRGHFRDSSISSLESWTASSDGMDGGMQQQQMSATVTPAGALQHFHILACNSPDIRELCKSSTPLYQSTTTHSNHHPHDTIMSIMETNDEQRTAAIPYWNPNTTANNTTPCNTHPLVTPEVESLTRDLEKIHFYSPQRSPLQPSCDIKKPTRHRRVSYEMLPSMNEIAFAGDKLQQLPPKKSPISSRHRRNTTQLVLE